MTNRRERRVPTKAMECTGLCFYRISLRLQRPIETTGSHCTVDQKGRTSDKRVPQDCGRHFEDSEWDIL